MNEYSYNVSNCVGAPIRPVYGQPMQPVRPAVGSNTVPPPRPHMVRPSHPPSNIASQPMIPGQPVASAHASPPSANALVSPMQNMNLEHQRPNVPLQVSA